MPNLTSNNHASDRALSPPHPSVQHHVPEELLLDYAQGNLSAPLELAIASHLAYCESCRERVRAFEALGGMTLTDITLTAPGDAPSLPDLSAPLPSLDAFWVRLEAECDAVPQDATQSEAARSSAMQAAHECHRNDPANSPYVYPLQRFTGAAGEKVRWRSLGALGRQSCILVDDKVQARLLDIRPGQTVPAHRHGGMELTLVLSGSFEDEGGVYASGDLQIETEASPMHQPRAHETVGCLCLTVTDTPLRFKGIIPRLIRSLYRM